MLVAGVRIFGGQRPDQCRRGRRDIFRNHGVGQAEIAPGSVVSEGNSHHDGGGVLAATAAIVQGVHERPPARENPDREQSGCGP